MVQRCRRNEAEGIGEGKLKRKIIQLVVVLLGKGTVQAGGMNHLTRVSKRIVGNILITNGIDLKKGGYIYQNAWFEINTETDITLKILERW